MCKMKLINLLSERKFAAHLSWLGSNCACLLDMGSDAPAAPDYTPVANASKESAEIMAKLGQDQLAESRRQYDESKPLADKVVNAQIATMNDTAAQGKDYYDYMVSQQRPVEGALNAEAMAAGSDSKQQEQVDRAVADSNGGFTRSINQAMREGRRYGIDAIANTGAMAVQQAQNTSAAATIARDKEKALGYAKKLDVAGLYRGLPGASQGAYSVSTNAGNSATQNTMAPGQALVAGMGQGANTVGNGRTILQNGLGGILNSQTGAYSAGLNASGEKGGFALGAISQLGSAYISSKQNG